MNFFFERRTCLYKQGELVFSPVSLKLEGAGAAQRAW